MASLPHANWQLVRTSACRFFVSTCVVGILLANASHALAQEIRQRLTIDAPQTLPIRLEVAQMAGATRAVDPGLDKPLPPALPSGFDARLRGPNTTTDLRSDVRGESDRSVFEVVLRPRPGTAATRISWNRTSYPAGVLRLVGGGGSWDLNQAGEALIPAGQESSTLEVIIDRTALPVELATFAGVYNQGYISLRWTTASETRNAGFEVQKRSNDVSSFEPVGFVEGAGTTTRPHHYSHRVPVSAPGTYAFRLIQIDTDGTRTTSPEVLIRATVDRPVTISPPSPNPASTHFRVRLAVAESQPVRVALYDILGRRVRTIHDGPLTAERAHTFSPETSRLASGAYFFVVEGEAFREVQKVHVVR